MLSKNILLEKVNLKKFFLVERRFEEIKKLINNNKITLSTSAKKSNLPVVERIKVLMEEIINFTNKEFSTQLEEIGILFDCEVPTAFIMYESNYNDRLSVYSDILDEVFKREKFLEKEAFKKIVDKHFTSNPVCFLYLASDLFFNKIKYLPGEEFTSQEITAVYLHEVGHIKNLSSLLYEAYKVLYEKKQKVPNFFSKNLKFITKIFMKMVQFPTYYKTIFDYNFGEKSADDYAVSFGYGIPLKTALDKIFRADSNLFKKTKLNLLDELFFGKKEERLDEFQKVIDARFDHLKKIIEDEMKNESNPKNKRYLKSVLDTFD
jgi:hypothetical protein